jgi:phosphatidylserine decarboxylase
MANDYLESKNIIRELESKIKEDKRLARLLELSLQKACSIAKRELNPSIYKTLTWPIKIEEYLEYLNQFSRYVPKQSEADTKEEQMDEIHSLSSQFYWLINQQLEEATTLQEDEWFSHWIIRYVKSWGSFLDSTESFNPDILETYVKNSPKYRVEDSMIENPHIKSKRPNSPSGWLTYNQFFARSLNPGLRSIDSPMDNSVATCPADCFFKAQYLINSDSRIPEIKIKKTHKYASIETLLKDSHYKNAFNNGTFVHYYLAPYSYHRFHFPVSGILKECYTVKGLAYTNPIIANHDFYNPDGAEGGFEFTQMRGILTIDTTNSPYGNVGVIAVIPVGLSQVESVNMIAKPDNNFLKGDEFGYFLYGGSDIILLFQNGVNPKIDENKYYRHYGTKIALCQKK